MPTHPQQAEIIEGKPQEEKANMPSQKITVSNKDLGKQPTIDQLLFAAVQQGADIETLNRLLDLKERIDAKNAEMAFNEAMANFQSECPIVPKLTPGSKTKTGVLAFKYAALEDILNYIKEPATKNGLSFSWDSQVIAEGKRRITTCTITHVLGHKKTAKFESALDEGTQLMNNIQKEGSTISYGRRYSLMLALGIVAEGEDDDGKTADKTKTISDEQKKKIENLIGSSDEILYKKILDFYGIESLNCIPADRFQQCVAKISKYKQEKMKLKKEQSKNDVKGTQEKR